MGFIGKKPTAAPLTSSEVADDIITLAKMAGGTDGNIITYDASGNPAVVATGSDGQVLTSTGAGSPPAFEAIPGGGKILQVVEGDKTDSFATNNTSGHQASGLSVSITPSATSSKVFVISSFEGRTSVSGEAGLFTMYRDSTNLAGGDRDFIRIVGSGNILGSVTMQCLDSPSSTSSLTYQVYCFANGGGAYAVVNDSGIAAKITVFEIGA